jgi:hypothetical protein
LAQLPTAVFRPGSPALALIMGLCFCLLGTMVVVLMARRRTGKPIRRLS